MFDMDFVAKTGEKETHKTYKRDEPLTVFTARASEITHCNSLQ